VLVQAAGERAYEIAQGGGAFDDERAVEGGEHRRNPLQPLGPDPDADPSGVFVRL
jgi:hypothetical protein